MDIQEFKALGLERDELIEYQKKDEQYNRRILPGYFQELVEELPDTWKEGRVEPPFATIAHGKDKNGCYIDVEDIRLDDIIRLKPKGKSSFPTL